MTEATTTTARFTCTGTTEAHGIFGYSSEWIEPGNGASFRIDADLCEQDGCYILSVNQADWFADEVFAEIRRQFVEGGAMPFLAVPVPNDRTLIGFQQDGEALHAVTHSDLAGAR